MPYGVSIWGPIAVSGLSALGGYLSSKSKSKTTPTLDPAYLPLRGQALQLLTKRLQSGADLTGYGASGAQNINHTFDVMKQSQDNNLTARGLSTSPVAAAVDATRDNARAGQLTTFRNGLPLLQRQLQADDFGLANQLMWGGRGTETTGESGGGAAGSVEGIAAMLGYLQAIGAFKKKSPAMYGGGGNGTYYEPNDINGWG